jgi:hypothetical protein
VWTEMTGMTWELYTAPGFTAGEDRLALYRLLESKGADINAICFVPGIGTTSPLRYAGTHTLLLLLCLPACWCRTYTLSSCSE